MSRPFVGAQLCAAAVLPVIGIAAAFGPPSDSAIQTRRLAPRFALALASPMAGPPGSLRCSSTSPGLGVDGASALATWQTIGGCGAGASAGTGTGLRWIGRGTSGGLFDLQCQSTYSQPRSGPGSPEHHVFLNALVTRPVSDRWIVGMNLPLVAKYMRDPYETGANLSNTGIGDVSLLGTRRVGAIGATMITATLGLPTGEHDGRYKTRTLNHTQQRGFGRFTGSLTLDHTHDEVWGVAVIGATAAWRGGQNSVDSYRAPVVGGYAHVGWLLGPFVPAVGLALSALSDNDRDQTVVQVSGRAIATASVTLEWSNDWLALLVGASLPYQYDGIWQDTEGRPRTPFGFGLLTIGAGISVSPF